MTPSNHLLNVIRLQVESVLGSFTHTRVGTVSAYDPNAHAAKVLIQPSGTETGWLPIFTPWIGNGWGMYSPPTLGDMVKVHYQEGNFEAGIVGMRGYNDSDRPLPVPSGEFWLVHKSGSSFKFSNDGSVNVVTNTNLTATVNGATSITSTGNVTITTPTLHVQGDITASGNISDGTRSMGADRTIYDGHTHPGIQTGSGNSGVPNQPQ